MVWGVLRIEIPAAHNVCRADELICCGEEFVMSLSSDLPGLTVLGAFIEAQDPLSLVSGLVVRKIETGKSDIGWLWIKWTSGQPSSSWF